MFSIISQFIAGPDGQQRLELTMSKTRSTATRDMQSLTGMLTINKKVDIDPDSSDDDAGSSNHDHDYQPQIVGQTATHFLVSFINPDGTAGHQWEQCADFDEDLVEHWQAVQEYVKPHATQRSIEDGMWYIEIGELIFVVEDAFYHLILSAIPMSQSEEFQKQVWARYGDSAARMVVGHDDSHYLVLSRVPGHELRASWVRKESVDEALRNDYWAWHYGLKAVMEAHQGEEADFRPDLLMLEGEGTLVAMAKKIASEAIVSVIRERHPDMLEGGDVDN